MAKGFEKAIQQGAPRISIGLECNSGVDGSPATRELLATRLAAEGFEVELQHLTIHSERKACRRLVCERGPHGDMWEKALVYFKKH